MYFWLAIAFGACALGLFVRQLWLQRRLLKLRERENELLERLEQAQHEKSERLAQEFSQPFLDAFAAKDASFKVHRLCGRFIRGVNEEELSVLSDEPDKELSWVCGEDLLQSVLGKGPTAAMVHIGFGLDWIRARMDDGTTFRLVVFPASDETRTTLATWDNLFELVHESYGDTVAGILAPHMAMLKSVAYADIDPAGRLREVSNLPVAEKLRHPEYMTGRRLLATVGEAASLYEARAFFYHAIGCNSLFKGNGMNYKGKHEYMTLNRRLSEIPGARWIDLQVTLDEIADLLARKPDHVAGNLKVGPGTGVSNAADDSLRQRRG